MYMNRTAARYRISVEYDDYGIAKMMSEYLKPSHPARFTFQALDAKGVALWTEDGDPSEAVERPGVQQITEPRT